MRKWIDNVQSCVQQSSVDGVDELQYELRESQVGYTKLSAVLVLLYNIFFLFFHLPYSKN